MEVFDDDLTWHRFGTIIVCIRAKNRLNGGLVLDKLIYLDTYLLQKDMRIRMPKAAISNVGAQKGESMFDIYFNPVDKSIVLKISEDKDGE